MKLNEGIVPVIDYMVYRECTPGWRILRQAFPLWDLTYVLRGKARYLIDGVSHELAAGDVLCMPRGCVRQARTDPEDLMTCYAVNFALRDLHGREAALPFPLVSHIGVKKDLIRLFEELSFAWTEQQSGYALKSRTYLTLIILRLYELMSNSAEAGPEDYRVKRATRYVLKHYAERLTVGQLAQQAGLSPVYFGTLFKKQTGLTVSHFLMRARVRVAENMLRSGEFKVLEVAARCGYKDVYHFYKHFKSVMGTPPSKCIPKSNS
jgi:AraC-like DNA-binding protein